MPQKGIKIGVVSVKSERRLELTDIICHLTLSFGFTIKKISSINLTLLSVICTYSGAEESFQWYCLWPPRMTRREETFCVHAHI